MTGARRWITAGLLSLSVLAALLVARPSRARRTQPRLPHATPGRLPEPSPAAAPARARPRPPAEARPTAQAGAASTKRETARAAGSEADSPSQIPPRGWWQIAKRVVSEISEDRVLAEAAGVTFYALLAIFPALAALVSLYGLVADPKTIADQLSAVSGFMPQGGMQILHDQIQSLTSNPSGGLGLGAIVGLLTSLWSANAGMKALFDALNVVYEQKEQRSFIWRTVITLAFTLGALVFVILAMSGVVVLPAVLDALGLGGTTGMLLSLARWPLLVLVLSLFLAVVYRYGPSRLEARWRWVSWGGVGATLLWLLVSIAFSYYVSHFGNYNKTYGSLGAAIGFMTWIWLSTSVVLIGAEVNAEMEHQTARDSTIGGDKKPGERRAKMADEVAAS